MNYIELVKLADVVLRDKFSWKRFIDGTPLVNDLPFYMADFARAAVAQEREAIAQMFEGAPALVQFAQNDKGGCLICGFTPKLVIEAIRARGTT